MSLSKSGSFKTIVLWYFDDDINQISWVNQKVCNLLRTDLRHSTLVMHVHIGSPGITLIRTSERQRDIFDLNWRMRRTFGNCSRTCTPSLLTRWYKVTNPATMRNHSQSSLCFLHSHQKREHQWVFSDPHWPRWHCNFSHQDPCQKVLHKGKPLGSAQPR